MKNSIGLFIFLCLALSSCATPTGRERMESMQNKATPHPAAFDSGFYTNVHDPAERPVRKWDFFYKKCELVSRVRYPSKSEYDCADPR